MCVTELCLDLNWGYEFRIYPNGQENFRKEISNTL